VCRGRLICAGRGLSGLLNGTVEHPICLLLVEHIDVGHSVGIGLVVRVGDEGINRGFGLGRGGFGRDGGHGKRRQREVGGRRRDSGCGFLGDVDFGFGNGRFRQRGFGEGRSRKFGVLRLGDMGA